MVLRKKLSRGKVLEFFATLPPCLIGVEACAGAHYWARELEQFGHHVKLMPAQYVKAYVKGNKPVLSAVEGNDGNDAEAICEAVCRPGMHFVAVNTQEQQDIQMLHRIRSRVVGERTALGAQFGEFSEQGCGGDGAHPGNAAQEVILRAPGGAGT